MIFTSQSKTPRQRGLMLIECMVYGTVLILISSLGLSAYLRCLDSSRHLQQNADDITRTLDAGERWREDIRKARQVVISENAISIIQTNGAVEYSFHEDSVWRHPSNGAAARILTNVKSSRMEKEDRQKIEAMRWEVELRPRQKNVRVRPLFTFLAVPGAPLE